MSKTVKSGKIRLNLDMHPAVKEQLLDLQQRLQADSMSEAVRRAVRLLHMLHVERQAGDTIILRDKDGHERELLIPL